MSGILLIESNFSDVEVISEAVSDGNKKSWYINGVYAQHSVVNRNRRIYPKHVMNESVDDYIKQYLNSNRAVGELNHPPTTQINPERIAIRIESLHEDGNSYIGKAKVLNTPCGQVIQGLLEGGVKIGVSTRADGRVKRNSQGIDEVQSGLKMSAIDAVFHPSAPDAFVEGLMEGQSFIWDTMSEDYEFVQSLKEDIKLSKSRELQEAKLKAFQTFMQRIRNS